MKNLLSLLLVFLLSDVSAQTCSRSSFIKLYIETTLSQDILYYLDFDKNEIPLPIIYFSRENISLSFEKFKGYESEGDKIKKNVVISPSFIPSSSISDSRFIGFNSQLGNDFVLVEIYFKREDYLNKKNQSEYETWRRYNAGIAYLFQFNQDGCLIDLKKTPLSYD